MPKWANTATLDFGLAYIRDNASRMLLINNYAAGDSYATVTAAALATVVMTTGTASSDYVISTTATSNRQIATVSKSTTASANSTAPDLHIAFTNGTNQVIWVTDETTNQQIVSGNTINFPAITYTSNQPT